MTRNKLNRNKKKSDWKKIILSLWFSIIIYLLFAWLIFTRYNLFTFILYTGTVLLAFKNMKIIIEKPHLPGMIAIGFVLTNYAIHTFLNDTLPNLNTFTISSITSAIITILLFAPVYYLGRRLKKTYKKGKVLR